MNRLFGDRIGPGAVRTFLWAVVGFNILLFGWIVLQAFRSSHGIWTDPLGVSGLTAGNFGRAWNASHIAQTAVNSIIVTGCAVVLLLALATPAAYALARSDRRIAGSTTALFAAGIAVPVQAVVIPYRTIAMDLDKFMVEWVTGWWDPRISLIICNVAITLPFDVFVLTGYFRTLPAEMEEAAAIDGAGPFRTFLSVMAPCARPGITTIAVLNVIGIWNELLLVLTVTDDPSQYTLPAGVANLNSAMQYTSDWGGLFAAVAILVVPMVLLFLFFGRKIQEGMTLGASK